MKTTLTKQLDSLGSCEDMEQNLLKIDFTERHTFLEKLSYYFCSFVCNHILFPCFQ